MLQPTCEHEELYIETASCVRHASGQTNQDFGYARYVKSITATNSVSTEGKNVKNCHFCKKPIPLDKSCWELKSRLGNKRFLACWDCASEMTVKRAVVNWGKERKSGVLD